MLSLLLACADPGVVDPSDTAPVADTDTDTDAPPIDYSALNGTEPAVAITVPTFSVLNQHGDTRTGVDLVGHPTVMWFYPAAGTAG
jgi:hypothetical protein